MRWNTWLLTLSLFSSLHASNNPHKTLKAEYELSTDRGSADIDAKTLQAIELLNTPFTRVADLAFPCTVWIRAETHMDQDPFSFSPDGGLDPLEKFHEEFFHRFFGRPERNSYRPSSLKQKVHQRPMQHVNGNHGSGFFVSSDGYIVTNFHVVRNAQKIFFGRPGMDEEIEATLVICDQKTDVAILKAEGENYPYLRLANSDSVKPGEWVVAVGSPFKLNHSITAGVISSIDRQDLSINELEDFFQTDAAINPGNSGGPLLDLYGKVVGVNTAIYSRSGGNNGIGFTIKSNMIRHILNQVAESGTISRGYLGAQLQPLDEELGKQFGKDDKKGALVTQVIPDSPAEKGGLKEGDVIIRVDGKEVQNPATLRNYIQLQPAGKKITLTVIRSGKEKKLGITLGTTETEIKATSDVEKHLGIHVEKISPTLSQKHGIHSDEKGVVVTQVRQGSPAQASGITAGTIIKSVNHQKVHNMDEYRTAIDEAQGQPQILLLVQKDKHVKFIAIKLPTKKN